VCTGNGQICACFTIVELIEISLGTQVLSHSNYLEQYYLCQLSTSITICIFALPFPPFEIGFQVVSNSRPPRHILVKEAEESRASDRSADSNA
jgi:hypothetical protein